MARPRKDAPAKATTATRTTRTRTPRTTAPKAEPTVRTDFDDADDTLQEAIALGVAEHTDFVAKEAAARRVAISEPTVDPRIAQLEAKVAELTALLGTNTAKEALDAGRAQPIDFGYGPKYIATLDSDGKYDPHSDLKPGDVVHIHFVEDGGPAFQSEPQFKGFELQVVVGSPEWESTVNPRTGRSWLTLTAKEQHQLWGGHKHSPGPWPGGPVEEDEAYFNGPSKKDIEKQSKRKIVWDG